MKKQRTNENRTNEANASVSASVPVQSVQTIQASNVLPAELQEEARVLRAQGASLSQIAKRLGISKSSAWEITKDVGPQLTEKTQAPIESLEEADDLDRLEQAFGTTKPKALLNYERLLRHGSRRSSPIRETILQAIEDRIYLDILGINFNPRNDGRTEPELLSTGDIKKLVLLRFIGEGKPIERQTVEAETQRIMSIFQSLRNLEDGAVQKHKELEEEVKRNLQPQKSSLEKIAEGVKLVRSEIEPVVKSAAQALGEGMSKGKGQPPPPQTPRPEQIEAEMLQRVEGQPPRLENLVREENEGGTFGTEGLPEEEETAENASEPSERPEVVGGSTSEVEKRLGGKKQH